MRLIDLVRAAGLEDDQVANWLIDRDFLAGDHGIYFTEAYGHEADITTCRRQRLLSLEITSLAYGCHQCSPVCWG